MNYKDNHLSRELIERASKADLAEYLRSHGEKLIRSGNEWRWAAHDSVTIRGSMWYRHSEATGGDAIDFLRHFFGRSFAEAVSELNGSVFTTIAHAFENPKERKPFELPPRNFSNARVKQYLIETRGIDADIVQHFIDSGTLYEDSEHHNCVFVGLDEHGEARYAHKRSSYASSGYRGDVEGSDKEHYAFNHIGTSPQVFVFEAPIDMLSYITLNKDDWQQHSYIALGGVGAAPLFCLLERHPHIVAVSLCLDNDSTGAKATARIKKQLFDMGYGVRTTLPQGKDWNDELTTVSDSAELSLQQFW